MSTGYSTNPASALMAVYAKVKTVAKSPEIAGDLKRLTAAIDLICFAPEADAEKVISIVAEMIPRPVLDESADGTPSTDAGGNVVAFSAAKARIRAVKFHHQGELQQ